MNFKELRHRMVQEQLRRRGIRDEKVLAAMEDIERHRFVSPDLTDSAYDDCALSIGEGQTISQPYMVALMTELLELKGDEKVLEIGTGSGYQSAVLSKLAAEVYSVERIGPLASRAKRLLEELGCTNVHVVVSDGTLGLPGQSPFDGIIVTAGAPEIPQGYIRQLKISGRLVIPFGSRFSQALYRVIKTPDGTDTSQYTTCVFVPLVGKDGWQETGSDY
jgi:protein-L-isoaspartate(D-aspartate) O-methyltransferase